MNQEKINQQNKAFTYYTKGLNSKEIAKLLDVSYRTVQSWMLANGWKSKRTTSKTRKKKQLPKF